MLFGNNKYPLVTIQPTDNKTNKILLKRYYQHNTSFIHKLANQNVDIKFSAHDLHRIVKGQIKGYQQDSRNRLMLPKHDGD